MPGQSLQTVVENLQGYVKSTSDLYLPSLRSLARKYRVSDRIVAIAVHVLAEKGLVECRWGRRTRIIRENRGNQRSASASQPDEAVWVAAGVGNENPAGNSSWELYCRLRDDITMGRLVKGNALPKYNYFAVTQHVAQATIAETFRLLQKENYIHKRGKRWIAGPEESSFLHGRRGAATSRRPVVLLLFRDYRTWMFNWLNPEFVMYPFGQAFKTEIEKHNIRVAMAYIDENEPATNFPKGMEQIEKLVVSSADCYWGAMGYFAPQHKEQLGDLIRLLSGRKRPVVILNDATFGPLPDRQAIGAGKHYAFCRCDEKDAVRAALDSLYRLGHRVVAAPHPPPEHSGVYRWTHRRLGLIKEMADNEFEGLKVVSVEQREDYWFDAKWHQYENEFQHYLLEQLGIQQSKPASGQSRKVVSRAEALCNLSPSLAWLTRQREITAVVAMNHHLARLYSHWFRQAGIELAERFSVIGFDNDPLSLFFPISTIDFGFDQLGYRAAHYIIGDIPVHEKKSGEILAEPVVIDRGSLKPPVSA